jgi:NAD(P)-dependent dehydrogenase (short-subunit alcohol dehydrogenase family)
MHLDSIALADRTVLVTGASGGIGAATVRALAAAGASVVAQYRNGLDSALAAVESIPPERRLVLPADLGKPSGARELWQAAIAWGRGIDVVVVNAAVSPTTPLDGPDDVWDAGWDQTFRVNVFGAGALMRAAARHFVERGSGTIVVLSSWSAEQGSRIADLTAYAASKAAVRNLAQTLARNYARQGLRVYVVAPGVADVGMGTSGKNDVAVQTIADGLAMGRLVDADEVASLITFLATDACASLSGATLDLNGASYIR